MISDIRRILGNIDVSERDGIITVSGIPANVMNTDIARIWKTSRINKYMFHKLARSSFSFSLFFGPDVVYMLQRVSQEARTMMGRRAAANIAKDIEAFLWEKRTNDRGDIESILDLRNLRDFKKSPLDHQTEFLKAYDRIVPQYELTGYMLAAPPGSGKTLTGLYLHEARENEVFVAVVPKNSLERVWEKALNEEYRRPQTDYWVSTAKGDVPDDKSFYICHYESLPRLMDISYKLSKKKVTIVLDESHNMNEINSARTNNFVKFCKDVGSKDVIWSSGTPLKAVGSEMIPFLRTTDKYFDKDTEERFKKIYGMSTGRANDIMANRLGVVSYRVDKTQVVTGEPIEETYKVAFNGSDKYKLSAIREEMIFFIRERMEHYQKLYPEYLRRYEEVLQAYEETLGDNEWEEYRQYRDWIKTLSKTRDYQAHSDLIVAVNSYERNRILVRLTNEQKKTFNEVKSVVKYIPLKVRGEALGSILGRARINCHKDMVEHIDFQPIIDGAEKKTLIFTSYVDVVKAADAHLTDLGYRTISVHGETNKDLNKHITDFAKNDKMNPLIATYQSLSTAVPLIMANVCIMLNQPFRAHEREQAVSRIHRLGQDAQVIFITVILDTGDEPNVSSRSLDIMEWSQRQVDEMMGTAPDVSVENHEYVDPEAELASMWLSTESFLQRSTGTKSTWLSW